MRTVSRARRAPATPVARDVVTGETPRDKVSVTIEKPALEAVRRITDNVSGFVNEAIKEKLYFRRLDEEIGRLDAEGVALDRRGYQWLVGKMKATGRRFARNQ